MAEGPTLDTRERLERVLRRLLGPVSSEDTLRILRTLEVLELAASAEAAAILRPLADGPADDWLTHEARAALSRLGRRPGGKSGK